jgi:hypothetical protein
MVGWVAVLATANGTILPSVSPNALVAISGSCENYGLAGQLPRALIRSVALIRCHCGTSLLNPKSTRSHYVLCIPDKREGRANA